MPSETTTACVSLLVFFRIRRDTFPYGVEDDASTISQTPTTHYANTCVKLTIVAHLSFSERITIANLSYNLFLGTLVELGVAFFDQIAGPLRIACVCVCVFFPSILDIKFVGRTSRGHTGGRSHRIFNPPSFCGACLDFWI